MAHELQTNAFTDPKFDPCAGRGGRDDGGGGSCACRTTPLRRVPVTVLLLLAATGAGVIARVTRRKPRG